MEIFLLVLNWLLPAIGGLLAILGVVAAKKLLDWLGVKRSEQVDAMIDKYVRVGVNAATVAATKYAQATNSKMAGGTKKAKAVKVVLDELNQSGITGVAEELISNRIESWLLLSGHEPGVPSSPE